MRIIALVAGLALAAPFAHSPAFAQQRSRSAAVNADPRAEALLALQRPVTIELNETRLEDIMRFVEQVGGVVLEVAWLGDDTPNGLDRDAAVTLSARGLPLMDFIERVIERAGDQFDAPTWQLDKTGAIEIGPRSALNRRKSFEIYPISDLTFTVPNYTNVPELDLDSVLQQTGNRGGGGTQSIFNDANDADPAGGLSEEEQAERIVDLIVTMIEPEQWEQNGGDGASIRLMNGHLLIRAPDYIHRQIGGYPFAAGAVRPSATSRGGRYVTLHGKVESSQVTEVRQVPVSGGAGNAPQP